MNLFGLSPGELIVILLIAMIVIGPEKLPETAASVGRWIREFRRVTAELTEQFADENPFTEIQRALSLTDEPASTVAPVGAALDTVSDPKPTFAEVVAASASTASVSQSGSPVVPRRSDYFDYPSYYSAIDDAWAHGGLNENHARGKLPATITEPIDDEWIHGVPVFTSSPGAWDVPIESIESGIPGEPVEVVAASSFDVEGQLGASSVLTDANSEPLAPGEPSASNGSHSLDPSAHHENHNEASMAVGAGVRLSEVESS